MTHEQNERLLTLLSEYLCFQPDAITPADVAAFSADAHLPPEDAYRMLLSAKLGLDPDRAEDWLLIRDALPKIIRRCDPADYAQDEILPMELFVRDDFLPLDDGTCLPQLGWFDTSFRFPAVKENNLVWMTVTPNEINTIQPCVRQSHGNVLTFGLGLGYYAFHCLLKPDVRRVTVVERDPDIISLFRALLLPHFPRPDALEIIQADAFDFAPKHLPAYDVVFTDLWHDVSDGLPLYQRMKALEVPGVKYLYWIEQTLRCYLR